MWYDDPVHDASSDCVDGRLLVGDPWRRFQRAHEKGLNRLVCAAGVTFAGPAIAKITHGVVQLVPENHSVDKDAVAIVVDHRRVGYVPKKWNKEVRAGPAVLISCESGTCPHVWIAVA